MTTPEAPADVDGARVEELVSRRLSTFMLVAIVAFLSLCATMAYQTIRMQAVINAEHAAAADRAATIARERAASCAYTRQFVSAFSRFEGNQAIAASLSPPASPAQSKARAYAFDTLFNDLGTLGKNACSGTPAATATP